MTQLPIASHFTALLALMLIALSVHIIVFRRKHKIALGDGGVKGLHNAIRAQGNFSEYAPFFVVLLGLTEFQNAAPDWLLIIIGSLFLLARISHAYSLTKVELREGELDIRFRVFGMVSTLSCISLLALILLF
jgi:uncharacterized membrane protein YecN with MAPEG domain